MGLRVRVRVRVRLLARDQADAVLGLDHPPALRCGQPLEDLHDVGRSYIELELLLARELGKDLVRG